MNEYINKVIHGDCLDILKQMPDKCVDLVLTSPPYNLGNFHHTGSKKTQAYEDAMDEKEYQAWQVNVLNELYRITKDEGSLFYNHKNRIKDGISITPYQWLLKTKWILKQEIVWFNGSQNFDKIRFYPMTERVYWFAKKPSTVLTNVVNHHDLFTSQEWPSVGSEWVHTRSFPLEMAQTLITCIPSAHVILDPFGGSCTTAVACKNLNRKYICIEKEEKYYNLCLERLAATPNSLFN